MKTIIPIKNIPENRSNFLVPASYKSIYNTAVMKFIPLLRFVMFVTIIAISILYFKVLRGHPMAGNYKANGSTEVNKVVPSSNDFILFESISKYLFISHIK